MGRRARGTARYEWCDKEVEVTRGDGTTVRSQVRRTADGFYLKLGKLSNAGYAQVNVTNDAGQQVTVAAAPMVLLAHHPAFRGLDKFPDSLETRHNPSVNQSVQCLSEDLARHQGRERCGQAIPTEPPHTRAATPGLGDHVINAGRRCLCLPGCSRPRGGGPACGWGCRSMRWRPGTGTGPDWIYWLGIKGGKEGGQAEARGAAAVCDSDGAAWPAGSPVGGPLPAAALSRSADQRSV